MISHVLKSPIALGAIGVAAGAVAVGVRGIMQAGATSRAAASIYSPQMMRANALGSIQNMKRTMAIGQKTGGSAAWAQGGSNYSQSGWDADGNAGSFWGDVGNTVSGTISRYAGGMKRYASSGNYSPASFATSMFHAFTDKGIQ